MSPTDLIKRFTKTPFETMLKLSGTNIRVETNCQAVTDQLRRILTPCIASALVVPDFILRVVAESEDDPEFETVSTVHCLSHNGLSFVSLGQKSFLACDRLAREAISFVSLDLVTDEESFRQRFLPALILILKESIEVRL
jgi:hypothetical protein